MVLCPNLADKWKQIMPSMDVHVMKPDRLSFYIASKIPVSESTRQELLDIDGTSYRLRRVIELLENFDHVRCKGCQVILSSVTSRLSLFVFFPALRYSFVYPLSNRL